MSSDESTGTHISAISNQTEKEKLKPHKPEQWEIDLIGSFLLNLYHRSLLTPDDGWCIKKADIRKEFEKNFATADQIKKFKELNGTANIGTLLHRCGFLINTPRGSSTYKIKNIELFRFRNMKLKQMDDLRVNKHNIIQSDDENLLDEDRSTVILSAEDNVEVDEEEPRKQLKYQGTTMQPRSPNYYPTNASCCICEEEFPTIKEFEEHIQQHGEDTDFEYLTTMKHIDEPVCALYYRLCKNSHYFCFEIETSTTDLILEKIILVQSHSFYNVYNTRLSRKISQNVKNRFFIDSHLFTIHVEQPIVLICHVEGTKDIRIIEQHHFMRSEEFPKINFSINPYRLPSKTLFKSKFTLADYFPPKEILAALKDDFYHEKLMKISNDFREYVQSGKKLQPITLGESLKILLQIEDIDTLYQYRNLTQQNVVLRKFENEYSFRLKTKQRLYIESILSPCDEVVLTTRTDVYNNPDAIMQLMLENTMDLNRKKNTYMGYIVAINTGRVSFKCDKTVNISSQYTIICRPSRLTMRYQYRSLELLNQNMVYLRKFLFPSKLMPMPISEVRLNLYNDKIALVPEQLQAVRNIAEGPRNDATYIIFGPPGTGKTTTLVEGILQLLKRSETKILVTASSNSACDEIALRLSKYLERLDIKRCLVRIYARSSESKMDNIDDDLLDHSNMYCGQFYPDVEILHEYRIVVCTLSVVAKLATGKFGRTASGNEVYTHLFIDEVAAAMETDALMAITTILKNKSSLIISGDHKQLGPILKSKRAKDLGLDISLMERLLERDCYRVDDDTGNYDRTIQTRLRRNYRSHPSIVNLYSGLYYNHNVEPHCKIEDVSLGDNWYKTKKQNFPIIFHAIYEPSMSDKQTTSLYNLGEIQVVMDYLKDLMYFGINGKQLNETDIGIISPYKKQYRLIQEELNLRKWFNIETGSVEIFQGKEKDVIIVSLVRSGTQGLGFLDSPRRLNVTLSRAKSILILIGNPNTLNQSSEFDYIIKECQRHNTFVGQKQTNNGETLLNQSMRELSLSNETIDGANEKRSRRRRKYNRNNRGGANKSTNKQTQNNDDEAKALANDKKEIGGNKKMQASRMFTSKKQANGRDTMQNSGKVTKSYVTGKRNNPLDGTMRASGQKIDQLFAELPKIPNKKQENNQINSPTNNVPNSKMNSQQLQRPSQYYNMQPTTTTSSTNNFSNSQINSQQLQPPQYYNMQSRPSTSSTNNFHNSQMNSQQLQPPQYYAIQPILQLQQQYCNNNNNMGANFHSPSTFYKTQHSSASPISPQQLIYASPYRQPFQPGTSGGVNQLNQNDKNPFIWTKNANESENKLPMNSSQSISKGNNANQLNQDSSIHNGSISSNHSASYNDKNPFVWRKEANESENKLAKNSSQSISKGNNANQLNQNDKNPFVWRKEANESENKLAKNSSQSISKGNSANQLNQNDKNPFVWRKEANESENKLAKNSSQSTSKKGNVKNEKEKLATAKVNPMQRAQTPTLNKTATVSMGGSNANASSMSREGSTNNSTSKSVSSNNSPKKNNLTNAKANIGKLNSGNSSSTSSSSSTNRSGTPLGVAAPMLKNDSAKNSTLNKTGATTANETNITANKRNVGLYRNIGDSNYSTVTPLSAAASTSTMSNVNSNKTTATFGATANVNSLSTSLAANNSTSNKTEAITTKETNATAPKRNVGLYRNIGDTNYNTITPLSSTSNAARMSSINSSSTTVTWNGRPIEPLYEYRRTSVNNSNKKTPAQESKCCIC